MNSVSEVVVAFVADGHGGCGASGHDVDVCDGLDDT